MAGEKRVDIKVGFLCNNNCRFCVQAHKRHLGNKTTEQIKRDLDESRKRCNEVVLTGGEPTIRKDIFELVSYAKDLGYKTIQIQTNGRMLAYKKFCERLIDAGANQFSPALHGCSAEMHDFLTTSKGSFEQIVQGIKNLKSLGQNVITNTVITKPNYRYLPEIADLLVNLKVNQFQLAFVHPAGNAYDNYDLIVPVMSLAAPYIRQGLQIGIDAGVPVMAEAVPPCMIKGYEQYISEKYIPFTEIKEMDFVVEDFKKVRITAGKMKFQQCKECKFDNICEGPWKEYPEKRGNSEFRPVRSNLLGNEGYAVLYGLKKAQRGNVKERDYKELKKEYKYSFLSTL